jgi:hypothetical protein
MSISITSSDVVVPASGLFINHAMHWFGNYFGDWAHLIVGGLDAANPRASRTWYKSASPSLPNQKQSSFVFTLDLRNITSQLSPQLYAFAADAPVLTIRKVHWFVWSSSSFLFMFTEM